MTRTYVVTGAASGIGKATANLLREQGHRVIGVDLKDADITVDLADPEARKELADKIASLTDGPVDGVLAIAGVNAPNSLAVKVNYFGAVSTLEELRPLLEKSDAPRAATIASFAAIMGVDEDLVRYMEEGDDEAAFKLADRLAEEGSDVVYASTKRALAQWVRRNSITEEWAGAGIPLNAIGPGVIVTPMTAPLLETEEGRAHLAKAVPMPLNGPAQPEAVAELLVWLTSPQNTHVTGQLIFIDGGGDASVRGDKIFG